MTTTTCPACSGPMRGRKRFACSACVDLVWAWFRAAYAGLEPSEKQRAYSATFGDRDVLVARAIQERAQDGRAA